jgi:hypothetical protein
MLLCTSLMPAHGSTPRVSTFHPLCTRARASPYDGRSLANRRIPYSAQPECERLDFANRLWVDRISAVGDSTGRATMRYSAPLANVGQKGHFNDDL